MKRVTRYWFILSASLLALSMILSACSPAAAEQPTAVPSPTAAPIVVKNADGSDFRLDRPAQKVVSLAPSNTEILFAVGAGKQVVGRDEFSNYPEEAKEITLIGGSMGKYNMEEIARLQPDLVLASPLTAPEVIQSIQEITPAVYVLQNPKDLEGMFANLVTVGILTGHQPEAEKLVESLRARAKAVQERVAGAGEKPTVFYELDATDPAKPWTAGPGSFIDMLIAMAGGQNAASGLQGEFAQISQEELIIQNPAVILLGDSLYGGITPEAVAARPGWAEISAVKNNRVLAFNDDLVSRPGPRLVEGLEEIARILHPDLFK